MPLPRSPPPPARRPLVYDYNNQWSFPRATHPPDRTGFDVIPCLCLALTSTILNGIEQKLIPKLPALLNYNHPPHLCRLPERHPPVDLFLSPLQERVNSNLIINNLNYANSMQFRAEKLNSPWRKTSTVLVVSVAPASTDPPPFPVHRLSRSLTTYQRSNATQEQQQQQNNNHLM